MQNEILSGISALAGNPQQNYGSVIPMLKQALNSDMQKIQLLMKCGVINNSVGQQAMVELAGKSYVVDLINNMQSLLNQNANTAPAAEQSIQKEPQNPFEAFNSENPGFFEKAGRGEVLEYIKNLDVDKDEISKIAKLVELIENSAVDSYLKQTSHEKSLNEENAAAKSKLTSYAQNSSKNRDFEKIFTREGIGDLSGEEFAKNEKIIAEQFRLGLLK